MPQSISLNSQNRYEIQILGQLDDSWLSWFGEVKIQVGAAADQLLVTTVSDLLIDQAALVGLVRRLHGLGIVLLSIRLL